MVLIKISLGIALILFILGFIYPLIVVKKSGNDPHGTHEGSSKITRMSGITIFLWLIYLLIFIFFSPDLFQFETFLFFYMDISFLIAGIILIISGFLFEIVGIISLGLNFRIELPKEKTNLITSGVYRYMRNPILFGMFLLFIGALLLIPNIILLFITISNFITFNAKAIEEEKFLLNRFGEDYSNYMNRVGRYFPFPMKKIFRSKRV